MLTLSPQNKPTINTDVAVPAVRHDDTNTHIITSGAQNDVANVAAIVSNSHHNMPKNPEIRFGKDQMVNTVRALPVAE